MPRPARHVFVTAVSAAALAAGALTPRSALAQPRPAALRVTVLDQTTGVIVGALVEAVAEDGKTLRGITDEKGDATITGLEPGTYTVRAEAAGFSVGELANVRLRSGNNRQRIVLAIASLLEEITVVRDRREAATDPRGDAFATVLSQEQIDQLPDDPEEMEEALRQMAGPGAVMRVNGFRGGSLPPKSQIQQIRFRRNMFAAESHEAGFMAVDIRTRPGLSAWRGSGTFGFRNDAMEARNAFAPRKVDAARNRFTFSVDGPIVPNRTSFSASVDGLSAYETQTLLAATPGGSLNNAFRQPTDRADVTARLEHALSKSHALRAEFQANSTDRERLGVGGFDLPERAYSQAQDERVFRFSESGPLSRRLFNELRAQVRWSEIASDPFSHDATIRVNDAFTAGGAGIEGGRRAREIEIADDLDLSLGKHSVRTGFLLEFGRYDADELRNGGGTFTFASLDEFEAGTPATYTRRIGDPAVGYSFYQHAWYVQDDIRVNKELAVSLGLRQEWQAQVDSPWNLAPRAGFAWAPFEDGKTTFRGGAGIFFDWYDAETYGQTLQLDGARLQDVLVQDPGYPDPGDSGTPLLGGRVTQDPDLEIPSLRQAMLGVERALSERIRMNVAYTYRQGVDQLRGRNVNAPDANGARPDPSVANVTEVHSIGGLRQHTLIVGFNGTLEWHRLFFGGNYSLSRARDDGDGALSLPADNLDPDEWGPSRGDVRHRFALFSNAQLAGGLRASLNVRAESAPPYNVTTGRDDNLDGVFNDRPKGVPRNSARADEYIDVNVRVGWRFGFGERTTPGGPGGGGPVVIRMRPGDDMPDMPGGPGGNDRVSFELYAQASNLFNRVNYTGYSGVQTSPFFGEPTSARPARRIEVGTRVSF